MKRAMSESDSKPTDDLAGKAGLADNHELVLSELKGLVWLEIVELFESDEAEALRENIDRLRCFMQQIQRGVVP
jgi:hypothetical protein